MMQVKREKKIIIDQIQELIIKEKKTGNRRQRKIKTSLKYWKSASDRADCIESKMR